MAKDSSMVNRIKTFHVFVRTNNQHQLHGSGGGIFRHLCNHFISCCSSSSFVSFGNFCLKQFGIKDLYPSLKSSNCFGPTKLTEESNFSCFFFTRSSWWSLAFNGWNIIGMTRYSCVVMVFCKVL